MCVCVCAPVCVCSVCRVCVCVYVCVHVSVMYRVWRGPFVTLLTLVLVSSFLYSPQLSEEFLSYTPGANFSEEYLLQMLMLVLVKSFSFNPDASFSEASLSELHTSC